MDEKKVREAIEALKIINLKRVHPFYDWEEMREIRDIAIEALKKQLPKKVENWNGQASCPRCKRLFGNMADIEMFCHWDSDCCNHCGQRLDWSRRHSDVR